MNHFQFFLSAGLCLGALCPADAQDVFPFDRLDSLPQRSSLVYSSAVQPKWVERTNYFWYPSHERAGDCFYLVDGRDGSRCRAATRAELDSMAQAVADKSEAEAPAERERGHGVLSPDGRLRAYVSDHNVYVREVGRKDAQPVQLSYDGAPGFSYSGLEWSPDGRRLAAVRVREVEVRQIPLLESAPKDQLQPRLHWRRYAKPGDALPLTLPVLFDVERGRQVPLDLTPYMKQYELRLTGWRADGSAFTFEYNERGHQRYVVAAVDAETGSVTPIIDERSDTFIEYYKLYRHDVAATGELLWLSERDGWRHLYLIDGRTGAVKRQMTRGEWPVRQVLRVDDEARTVYFLASGRHKGEDPYNLHYYKVGFDGGEPVELTPEEGNHVLTFSSDGTRCVDVYSQPDVPPVSVLRDATTGRLIDTLAVCDATDLMRTGWTVPEPFVAKGRDGVTDIWGTIFRPANFDPRRRYPVIEDIYAGPHDSFVNKNFSSYDWYITPLTELGFIVVKIDGMGTGNRSKAFHDVCWKNLADAGFPDRIRWMQAAAERYPYMDLSRVGIYGWSAGGQNALAALLFHGDFYKAAVAFCGCHDNRMDKIWWNEQWMGYPVDSSYVRSSNVANAHRLRGDLLLINGELDDNVDPASTLQVVDALVRAGKMFEQLYLPGKNHNLGGRYEVRRMYDFFVRKLRDGGGH